MREEVDIIPQRNWPLIAENRGESLASEMADSYLW